MTYYYVLLFPQIVKLVFYPEIYLSKLRKKKILRNVRITSKQEDNLFICLIYWVKMNPIVIKRTVDIS